MRRRDLPTAFHATAPLRLDFAGGWTDVPPFSAREGGVVVSGAIALRAHVELHLGGKLLRLVSEELGETLEVTLLESSLTAYRDLFQLDQIAFHRVVTSQRALILIREHVRG